MVTDKKLQQMARDVAYERSQMWRSHKLQQGLLAELMQIRQQGEEAWLAWQQSQGLIDWETRRNALLESILLHYRNLLEFLAPSLTGSAQQTVTARMFRDVPAPVDYRKQINNRLSHISQRRADLKHEEKFWDDLHTKLDELEAAWQGFLRALAANYPERVEWFTLFDFTLEDSADKQE